MSNTDCFGQWLVHDIILLQREGMAAAVLLKISILMVTFLMVNCNQYELCGQVVKSVQNRFAIDGDGARIVAPWIVALGVKKDEDKDGFDEFNVKCTGSILTNNIVIREALLHKHVENIFYAPLFITQIRSYDKVDICKVNFFFIDH